MDEIISLYVISVCLRTKWLWVQIPLLSLEFISVCPNVKPALCLHFRKFAMKEHQGILKHYHKNISEKKQTFCGKFLPFFVVFNQSQSLNSSHQIHQWIIPLIALIKLLFSCELSNAIWKNNIRQIPNLSVFQLYHYFDLFTEKYNGDLLQRTSYKKLKLFQFFMRVISKQWSYVPMNYLFLFILK